MNLVSTADAARTLKVSRRTVIRLAESGELPIAHKADGLRGGFIFDASEVESLAAQRTKARA